MKKLKWRNVRARYRYSVILLRELVRTDFKVRYQGSALGYIWSLLRPLFLFVIMYVVFVYFLRIGSGVPHWPVALLLGLVLWNFFGEITNQGLKAIVGKGSIIGKINFPRYVILLAVCSSALINLIINLFVVAVFMIINHVHVSWTIILLPLSILEVLIFALGLALILSTLYVKYRDISFVWEIIMQGALYASAVMFPMSRILDKHHGHFLAQVLLAANPTAQALQDARYTAVAHSFDTLHSISGSLLITLIPLTIVALVFVLGVWLFRKRSPYFAEEI